MFDFNFQPDTYWDGRGLEQGDAGYQRSQPSMFVALVGEYLPNKEDGEVEIVFVETASTTGDVMSLRAKPDKKGIQYRMVDEYEQAYDLPFLTSAGSLSFSELATMLNGIKVDDAMWLQGKYHVDIDAGEDLSWIRMESDFYPELTAWNEWNFEELQNRLAKKIDHGDPAIQ